MKARTAKTTKEIKEIAPMPLGDFYKMVDKSLQDDKDGKTLSTEDLKKEVRKWH